MGCIYGGCRYDTALQLDCHIVQSTSSNHRHDLNTDHRKSKDSEHCTPSILITNKYESVLLPSSSSFEVQVQALQPPTELIHKRKEKKNRKQEKPHNPFIFIQYKPEARPSHLCRSRTGQAGWKTKEKVQNEPPTYPPLHIL